MKPYFILLLLSTTHFLIAQSTIEADLLLQEMVSENKIVGITAGYSVDGKTVWSNAKGFSCLDAKTPFTETTLTRIASIAKPMTAIAIMQLVEQGLIDLDKPIQSYLPNFPKKEKGTITTRQLLAHTSGISQYQNSKEAENKHFYANLEEAVKVFADRPLLFEPGAKFFYTTYGYVVLGRIIEVVSEQSYEVYMQKNIWDKAGMTHTGVEKMATVYENKSCLYRKKKKRAKLAPQNDLSNRIPGGGFYTTLHDMLQFGNALLEGKLISESSLQKMSIIQFKEKEGNPYGLGWFFYGQKGQENQVIGHSGEQTGAATQLMIIPKHKTVVVVLANTSNTWKEVVTFSTELIRLSREN